MIDIVILFGSLIFFGFSIGWVAANVTLIKRMAENPAHFHHLLDQYIKVKGLRPSSENIRIEFEDGYYFAYSSTGEFLAQHINPDHALELASQRLLITTEVK